MPLPLNPSKNAGIWHYYLSPNGVICGMGFSPLSATGVVV